MAEGLMIEPFIMFGGLVFWSLTAVLFFTTVGFMSYGKTGKAFFSVVAWAAVVVFFTTADPISWVLANWQIVIYGTIAYLLFGTVFMIVRWQLLCMKVAGIYEVLRTTYLKQNDITDIDQATVEQKRDLKRRALDDYKIRELGITSLPMTVRDNLNRVTGWLVFWPFALTSFALGDLLVQVIDGVVRVFSGMMQRISDRQFNKFTELN